MKRRRRSHHNATAISLFSFQDIMTAVMGILILVTLIMALDLTITTTSTPAQQDTEGPVATRHQLNELHEQTAQWRDAYERLTAQAQRLVSMQGREQPMLDAARAELSELYQQLMDMQAAVEASMTAWDEQRDAGRAELLAEQMAEVEAEVRRLETAIELRRRHPRLSFIVQPHSALRPLLVELTANAIGVGHADQPDEALWLTAANRHQQLERLAADRDRQREYFVILLKPSGFPAYQRVHGFLVGRGFRVGTELIEESVTVLPGLSESP